MTKRYKAFLVVLSLLVVMITCSACEVYNETIQVEQGAEASRYFLYKTDDSRTYLNFLEHFDEDKFEIVDISVATNTYPYYYITYRYR